MEKKSADAENCFSTPWDAPLVPKFPFTYRNVEVMTLVYRTDPQAIAALLPPLLKPTSDLVVIHIYNMTDVEWLGPPGTRMRAPNSPRGVSVLKIPFRVFSSSWARKMKRLNCLKWLINSAPAF